MLIADPRVQIVDIAVPPEAQHALALRAAAAGKHLLCQKPLALDMETGQAIVAAAREARVKLAVNQQMRWEPGIRAARQLMERGWIGEPIAVTIRLNNQVDWSAWPWIQQQPRMELFCHSIHHFDTIRSLLGEPGWVTALAGPAPRPGRGR
jgi:predicted dehydrogenase